MLGASAAGLAWLNAIKWADDQLQSLNSKLGSISTGSSTVMYARDGKTILYTASNETRDPIEHYQDIPDNVVHATLAAEDRRFFTHSGIDYYSVGRSVVTDFKERRSAQGGSTITMQLVKRLYTSPEKSFSRKIHDAALAVELEKRLTKNEILKDYLNQVYYGEGAYGFKAAAEVYFGKSDLKKLTISEAALLARLVRRPTYENPFKDLKRSIDNRNDVLDIELDMGWISRDQYEKAYHEKVRLAKVHFGSGEIIYRAPYFVNYVLDSLRKDLPDIDYKAGGYTIETTLDPAIEKTAEHDLHHYIDINRGWRITTGAYLLMNSDGQILSMVGGYDYKKDQYNAVSQGKRQPGSSFKPIVYATALSTGAIRPDQSISSAAYHYVDPNSGVSWDPENDNGFGGNVSITQAIAGSINTCAARVMEKVTPQMVVSYAHDVFGYTSTLNPEMALSLGSDAVSPLEQARAYSIFMLHGDRATPYGITRVVGPDNQLVKSYEPDIHKNMLDSNVAAQMDIYLRAVVTGGTATRASSVQDARGKTGTTQDNRDAWFCGYTNNLLGICWVANQGYDSAKKQYYYDPMSPRSFGGIVPAEIWAAIMKSAQDKFGKGVPPPADNVVASSRKSDDDSMKADAKDDEPSAADGSTDTPQDMSKLPLDNPTTKPDNSDDPTSTPPAPSSPPDNPPDDQPALVTRSRRPSRPAQTEMVTVDICADTGLRATVYCPETISRTFVKGTEPTRYCTKHHQ
jgi:penicillin-binding protein 1A